MRPLSYPYTDVFCICFTRISSKSFKKIPSRWVPEINHHAPNSALVLIGCKFDLLSDTDVITKLRYRHFDSAVKYENSVQMAKNIGALTYIETSALTGEGNVSDFAEIITKCHAMFREIYPIKSEKKCIIC